MDCLTPQSKTSDKRSVASHQKKNRLPKQQCGSEGIRYASQIYQLIDYLSKPSGSNICFELTYIITIHLLELLGLIQEGIFRRSGKVKQQIELMNLVKKKDALEITGLLESNAYSVHEVATVLKNLLAEMSEPLLIESYYPFHCSLASKNI